MDQPEWGILAHCPMAHHGPPGQSPGSFPAPRHPPDSIVQVLTYL